jgi:hypothetical protein
MALNLERELGLGDAGLITFFENQHALWQGLAEDAFRFASKPITEAGHEVRQDDVIPALVIALRICEPLREYLAGKKLPQKYWYDWFAELIVDRLWNDLEQSVGGP